MTEQYRKAELDICLADLIRHWERSRRTTSDTWLEHLSVLFEHSENRDVEEDRLLSQVMDLVTGDEIAKLPTLINNRSFLLRITNIGQRKWSHTCARMQPEWERVTAPDKQHERESRWKALRERRIKEAEAKDVAERIAREREILKRQEADKQRIAKETQQRARHELAEQQQRREREEAAQRHARLIKELEARIAHAWSVSTDYSVRD